MEYTLIRSKRRTLAIELRPGGEVIVRAPLRLPRAVIDRTVAANADKIAERLQAMPPPRPEPTAAELEKWRRQAKALLPGRVAYFAARMGVVPAAVKVNAARRRWGSCSAAGNLNFSCRLMAYPPEVIDCVVVHELAHLRHRDHGPAFYAFVRQTMPDYDARSALLKKPPQ